MDHGFTATLVANFTVGVQPTDDTASTPRAQCQTAYRMILFYKTCECPHPGFEPGYAIPTASTLIHRPQSMLNLKLWVKC